MLLFQILVTDGWEIAFSIPVWCTSAGGLSFIFLHSWEMEKKVIVWSDSQKVALIGSMVEQTVFTVSDREGVWGRFYTVVFCEFNVVPRVSLHLCFCHIHTLDLSTHDSTAVPQAASLLPVLPLSSTPRLLPYVRVNNSSQPDTDNPSRTSRLNRGHRTHLFPPPPSPFFCLWLSVHICMGDYDSACIIF